ncbi:Ligand of numb-protein X 2 [Tilletia horrida]|nr:Ligand of numb-protein X 2 [Tilletia horrida]
MSDASNTSGRGSGTSSSEAAESSAAAAQRRKHNEVGHSQPILTFWNEKEAAGPGSDPKTHRTGSSGDDVKEVRMDIDNCASVPQELGQAGSSTTVTATLSNLAQAKQKQKQKQMDGQPSSGAEMSSALPILPAANTQQGSGACSCRSPHAGQSGSGQAVESAEDKHKKAQLQLIFDELVCDICLELMVDPAAMTPCQHAFCWSCAKTWMQDSSKCPTCATPITHAHLNHKLAKLVDLAVCLAPADRLRPEGEIKAAKTRLEQHKSLFGSGTIRATARYLDDDDHQREDIALYWPCLACRPGNRSGFQCTHRIPDPLVDRPPPARGMAWPQIEDADEDGVLNVEFHDSCTGCYAWIPSKAPGIDVRCFACSEACCQAFDSEGSCPGGFTLYKLNNLSSLDARTYTTPRALLDSIPLAGFNHVEKLIFQEYVDQKNITLKTMLTGIYSVAMRSVEASGRTQAASSSTAGVGPSAAPDARLRNDDGGRHAASRYTDVESMNAALLADEFDEEAVEAEESGAAREDVDSLRRSQWKYTLMSHVTRFESVRSAFRLQASTAANAFNPPPQSTRIGASLIERSMNSPRAGAASGSGFGSAAASGSSNRLSNGALPNTIRAPLVPLKLEGTLAEYVATSAFCYDCLTGILGAFLIWWWIEEKPKVAVEHADYAIERADCSEGYECKEQISRTHAYQKNHICKRASKADITSALTSALGRGGTFDQEDAKMIYTIVHEAATAAANAAVARLNEETRRVNEEVAAAAAAAAGAAASQSSSGSTRQLRPRGPSGSAR